MQELVLPPQHHAGLRALSRVSAKRTRSFPRSIRVDEVDVKSDGDECWRLGGSCARNSAFCGRAREPRRKLSGGRLPDEAHVSPLSSALDHQRRLSSRNTSFVHPIFSASLFISSSSYPEDLDHAIRVKPHSFSAARMTLRLLKPSKLQSWTPSRYERVEYCSIWGTEY